MPPSVCARPAAVLLVLVSTLAAGCAPPFAALRRAERAPACPDTTLGAPARAFVVDEVGRTLHERAFASDTDFSRWDTLAAARREAWLEAPSPQLFGREVNRILRAFDVSHLAFLRQPPAEAPSPSVAGSDVQDGGPPLPSDTLVWLDGGVAVVSIRSFARARYDRDRVDRLFGEAARARALVLDLRANPGGQVRNVRHLTGRLWPAGTTLGAFVKRADVERFARRHAGRTGPLAEVVAQSAAPLRAGRGAEPYAGPVAVLTDGFSASGSEIVAAAVRGTGRGLVIARGRTRGSVLLSRARPLPCGFELRYPIGEYVPRNGRRIEGVGVLPDRPVPDSLAGDEALWRFAARALAAER